MRTMTLQTIDETIQANRKEVNQFIRATASKDRQRRKIRPRSKGEREALNQIAIARWKKAVEAGKIKFIGERVLYYDYS